MSARTLRLLAAASAALAVFPVAGSWAVPDPSARVEQLGWWSGAAPATRTLGVAAPLSVPSPPDQAPVTLVAGDPSGVVAIGVAVSDDAAYVSLSVPLAPSGSEVNGAAAVIEACPITEAWAPATNGPRTAAPAADCERGLPGDRQPDGSWTFRVPAAALGHGVLLAGAADSAGSFRIPFTTDPAALLASASRAGPAPPLSRSAISERSAAPAPDPVEPSFVTPAPMTELTPTPPTPTPRTPASMAPPLVTPVATEASRHVPGIPAGATGALAAVALAAFVLAGLSIGRRLRPLEVAS